jgi:beta-glucosidase
MIDGQAGSARRSEADVRARADELLAAMTQAEKAGQLTQYFSFGADVDTDAAPPQDGAVPEAAAVERALAQGGAGSLLFVTDPAEINRLQRLAIDGNRLGIPALVGLNVIHGLRTILPVPIALAASWDSGDDRAGSGCRGPGGAGGRHPLDLRPDGRHRPGPALGPHHRGCR